MSARQEIIVVDGPQLDAMTCPACEQNFGTEWRGGFGTMIEHQCQWLRDGTLRCRERGTTRWKTSDRKAQPYGRKRKAK